jgi:exopolysaccharide biosynthesis polyprenyl glycosylphosphotransferase
VSASIAIEELYDALDPRTLEILARRRTKQGIRRRGWVIRRALVSADTLGLFLAFVAAELLYPVDMNKAGTLSQVAEFAFFGLCLPCWVVAAKIYGLYDKDEERTDHSTADDFSGVFHLVTVGTWLLYAASLKTDWFNPQFGKLFLFWALAVIGIPIMRSGARAMCRRQVHYLQNTVIVGAGDVGQLIARKLLQHHEYGLNLVGFVDDEPKERRGDLGHLTLLGSPDDLPQIVRLLDVERVIFAFSRTSSADQVALIRALRDREVQIDVVPRLFDVIGPRVDVHDVEGLPVLSLRPARISRSSRLVKRMIDIIGASLTLVVLAPLFLYIAWRIRRDSSGPAFFQQTRLGMDEREFNFLKFRSMHTDTDPRDHEAYIARFADGDVAQEASGLFKLEQGNSVTPFGQWLRRTSLDELPQLINVLRGEMSLVGPRPCIPYEIAHFEPHHFERFNVPAGITGLWQVTARAHSTFLEALDMDVAYARSCSIGLDIRLLFRTPLQLLRPTSTR